jgi:protein SCO1
MKRKLLFYLFFFVVLFGGFLLALKWVNPGYFEVKMPVLNYVKPFNFTDQYGQQLTEKEVAGKVYVAEYFFTTCKGICPKMNTNMKKVFDLYNKEAGFMILSHTVDPETDSAARLNRYADSLEVNNANWRFLTGTKDSLYNAARVSYLLDDPKNNNEKIENQFIHTQFFALIDKSARVRKIYDGLKKEEVDELIKDIPKLLREKESNTQFVNALFNNNPQ